MAIPKLDLELYEGNILDFCWKAGGTRTTAFDQFDRNEIAAVNIVACCKEITDLIEENSSTIRRSNVLATIRKQNVTYKDISRLAYGVTDIYRCQVNILLGDTQHLLDQMKRTNLDFVLTTTKSVVVKESAIRVNRKRKCLITNNTKVTVSKRPRLKESELLNKTVQEYYANMLSECQLWQSESTHQVVKELQDSIELPRSSTHSNSYHAFTITEEIQIHEDQSVIISSEGFGDGNELDLTIFEELYPNKSTRQFLKRPSTTLDPTDILPDKMPRLDELNIFQADNANMTQIYLNNVEPVCTPSLMSSFYPPVDISFRQPKNPRKRKLIIDKHIQYSQEQLIQHRSKYINKLKNRVVFVQKASELLKTPNEILCKLNKNIIVSNIINHTGFNLSNEEMEYESEITLKSIFGHEFTENIAKEIFVQARNIEQSRNQDVYDVHPVPLDLQDILSTLLLPEDVNKQSNNNIFFKKSIDRDNNNFDTHSVMMDLLNRWRNNPKILGINAQDFIKSFEDRIKASLAFCCLLFRDHFIEISKQANSIEMDQITLGKESIKLIENLTQSETF
ncbi:uncharacterized protein LOC108046047 isoform X2 [Drosophila rhopaloa]|uniref:Rad21/Rec8-like protein N-terminal domain-containing protein n=1 Tax=Drosophila rhopaloa TaxID=1041015 RepID=A0ABM5HIY7_DRORH|nr:uncharacterized protein LOC108046047 isoform X2 [Drosophila rhopaloa]